MIVQYIKSGNDDSSTSGDSSASVAPKSKALAQPTANALAYSRLAEMGNQNLCNMVYSVTVLDMLHHPLLDLLMQVSSPAPWPQTHCKCCEPREHI